MDLSQGAKRLTNRKRAQPASSKKNKERPEVSFLEPLKKLDVEKEFSALPKDEVGGIRVTRKEKEIVRNKSLKQRRELPEFEIDEIVYSVMSHEELENLAVFDARNTEDFGTFSVNDPRGGTIDHSMCSSCNLDNNDCPGHFGIIRLNEKIIHPMFRREVVDILTSICGSCGGLLLPYDTIKEKGFLELEGSKRLRAIADASKGFACRRNMKETEEGVTACVANPTYLSDKLKETGKVYYTREKKKGSVENFKSIDEVITILESISKEDAEILGFTGDAHPINFIMKSLPVIPICARPPVLQDGETMKDDLTSMYQDIIRINNELAKETLNEAEREKKVNSLIWAIEHMINNADKKYGQGKNKVYQSIKDRIQGKEGLIRSHLMGKRVNFSARTVIGPDPTLRFGQVRVPEMMAPYLTQHEVVDANSLKKLTALLRAGKITYVFPSEGRSAGQRIKVTPKIQETHPLLIGDEVERWLENGDYVVFNRQPTLHKQGIMGYEVVLGKPKTIGVHLGVTRQHNAD